MGNPRCEQVADFLASFGLVDLLGHFRKYLQLRHMQTWFQVKPGKLLQSCYNYILGLNLQMFKTVGFRDLRKFSSYHFALRTRLIPRPT